ncbi:oxidoreductase [Streptomyces phage Lizz]|nr:oxidoreductase [Streptomyces phage PHTowN]QNO12872.1 oxidoreductase [Streptomyces phage ShakeNBake]QYW07602.1 oxidoreductase [Streptomyces phage Lizz]
MKLLILGCGPAGLIAAHAAYSRGVDFVVVSKARKSFMNGAQYLHAPIPGVSLADPFLINYEISGSVAGYRDKVYGPDAKVEVSPETLVGRHLAWDIREAYDSLWSLYGSDVHDVDITPTILSKLIKDWKPNAVISTIPANILCYDGRHKFLSEQIWATNELECQLSDNTVLCNGEPGFDWYRASKILGFTNTEWPHDKYPLTYNGQIWRVIKPISTSCRCFPDVHRMGRYGKWTKGVLSHEAWEEANKIMDGVQTGVSLDTTGA